MSDVKRYDPVQAYRREGLYVDAADYDALAAKLVEARRLLGDARETGDPCVLHEDTQRRIDAFLAADKGTGMRGFQNVDDPSFLPPPTYPPESESP